MKRFIAFLTRPALAVACAGCLVACRQNGEQKTQSALYLGGDLSYVNEMEDCGGKFRDNGLEVDPFALFSEKGANIVRVRLFHSPTWTHYSNLQDVTKTIRRTKAAGMKVLLDFHYSDDWADPGDQIIPAAWKDIGDVVTLGDSLYQYTIATLEALYKEGLVPEFVQVGNETNSEILVQHHVDELTEPINWQRNVHLFNRGLDAVNDFNAKHAVAIQAMVHIAQPENAFAWFDSAFQHHIHDFEWIGLSYYPLWSQYKIDEAAGAIDSLKRLFNKRIMIVETAYPYSLENYDSANNLLGDSAAVLDGYPPTPAGQLKYMQDLTAQVLAGGAEGVIYWEPAWISTECRTRWGQGSHWENAAFFDAGNNNNALPVFQFFRSAQHRPSSD
ncbi:MAG: arabinogalactan endo-1,4-beta-galactosidase [Bacteroidia bacterium]|nr:arabinogalactan endo-1,4-beta-galactosidase [Bacteroidia bacterium]